MPGSSRAGSTRSTRSATNASSAKSALEKTEIDDLEAAPIAKTTRAKATSKVSTAKNPKKRARTDLDDSLDDDLELNAPPKAKKAAASRAALSDDEDYGAKPSSAKAKTVAKKAKASSAKMGVDEDEKTPKAATASAKKASGAKAKQSSAKIAAVSEAGDEAEAGEPTLVEVPTDFEVPALATGALKIVSWNVAGYRAILTKGFEQYLKNENPDIICLQEPKVPTEQGKQLFGGYHAYFFGCKTKPGLHGTALLTKIKPIKVEMVSELDDEGRVIVAEYDTFFILNTYVPNSGQKLERLSYRLAWDKKLQQMFLKMQQSKPVIWCGDLNVARDPIDLANPTTNVRFNMIAEQNEREYSFTTHTYMTNPLWIC